MGFGAVAVPVLVCLGLSTVLRGAIRSPRAVARASAGKVTADLDVSPQGTLLGEPKESPTSAPFEGSDTPTNHPEHAVAWETKEANSEAAGIALQKWSRLKDEEGRETLSGQIRIEYAESCRTAVAHVPWQPAFKGLPEVSLEAVDGDEAELQLDMLRSYGMRISARRSTTEDDCGYTVVEFFVQPRQLMRAAA
jgi:hypothetical protein